MTCRFKVLFFDRMHSAGTKLLQEKCDLVYLDSFGEESVIHRMKDVDAIIIVRRGEVTRKIIESSPRLKVIGKHGVGVEKIDLLAAKEHGVSVVYTPTSNYQSVAEHFVTLALMLAKRIKLGETSYQKGRWKNDPFEFLGMDLFGKTLGVMGFGRIGQQTARICRRGFEMSILYSDIVSYPEIEKELRARRVEKQLLFKESDFISINLPLIPQTQGLVNAELIKLMKPTSFLLNMARGPIWNEKDVVRALAEKWISGVGTDVFESEPTSADNPLFQFDSFVGTPHMGAHTEESMMRSSLVAEDILAVLEGKAPRFPVPAYFYPDSSHSQPLRKEV